MPTGSMSLRASDFFLLAAVAVCFGISIVATLSAMMRHRRLSIEHSKRMASSSIAMPDKSEIPEQPSLVARLKSKFHTTRIRTRNSSGEVPYREVIFCAIVLSALAILGHNMSNPEHVTYYGLHVLKVLPPDSMKVVSPSTGPLRTDICPENDLMKYEPKAGYTMCKFTYVDRGCMDIGSPH